MTKNQGVLLLFSTLSSLIFPPDTLAIKIHEEPNEYSVQNEMLVTILKNCNLGLKNIVIFDSSNDSSTFEAVFNLQPMFTIFLASWFEYEIPKVVEYTEFQGIIIAGDTSLEDDKKFDEWGSLLKRIIREWRPSSNCTIIVIPKPNDNCTYAKPNLIYYKRLYISSAYYICLHNKKKIVYTHDLYGNSQLSFWQELSRDIDFGNNWTLYQRFFEKDDICQEFFINREFSTETVNITIGVPQSDIDNLHELNVDELYNEEDIKVRLVPDSQDIIEAIKKLLRVKVKYYIGLKKNRFLNRMKTNKPVDFLLYWIVRTVEKHWDMTLPIYYHEYIILSHNQGYMSPLEKIGNFYGRWTLISLIIILILTFIVVWFKMNRNISFAIFDVLRLLINGGVSVPINTSPLKIFFSMIFLYFLVMQATFSGHLAEFLTKPQLRKNIDSVEDLKDPRIKTIYSLGYNFNEIEDYEILVNKTKTVKHMEICLKGIIGHSNSACVGTKTTGLIFLMNYNTKNKYYVSKNRFAAASIVFLFRKRFPLKDRFAWALIYLTETTIIFHEAQMEQKRIMSILQRREAHWKKDFRPIALKDLVFTFILLGVGHSLGCICFLFEILIWKIKIKKQQKDKRTIHNRVKNRV